MRKGVTKTQSASSLGRTKLRIIAEFLAHAATNRSKSTVAGSPSIQAAEGRAEMNESSEGAEDRFEPLFLEADGAKAVTLMHGRFGRENLMPLASLSLPVMSSHGVVLYRVEWWNKATGKYVGWRPLADGSIRINEFPPGTHDLLRSEPLGFERNGHSQPTFEDHVLVATTRPVPTEADETFLRALGFSLEELPNNERLAPYIDEEP